MHLKKEILKQFGSELVPGDLDFPTGYTKSGTKVWIRTDSDVADVWSFLRNNEAVSLCIMAFLRFQSTKKVTAVQVIVIVTIQDRTRKGARERKRSSLHMTRR